MDFIDVPSLSRLYYCGPPLCEGPLPAVFYFSLSAEESLCLDPYNQIVNHLVSHRIRVFSLTLPKHDGIYPHYGAIEFWAQSIAGGHHILDDFAQTCSQMINFLLSEGYLVENKISTAGLSRGVFVAAHLAAVDQRVSKLLGFSPLTNLEEYLSPGKDVVPSLDLKAIVDKLGNKTVRFYIGNRDTRVGTSRCFSFIESLVEASYAQKYRSPPIELVVFPSIGHRGHGTPPHIFRAGAEWLR